MLFSLLVFFAFAWQIQAQEVQIGSGSETGKHLPIEPYYGYSYSQQIYLASEINASGTITAIKFHWNGAADMSDSDEWVIYMGHTTKTEFTGNDDWVADTLLTEVFNGTVTFPSPGSDAWITIDISDFDYNGTDNLIIAVEDNAGSYDSNNNEFFCSATTTDRSIEYHDDNNNPDPANPPSASNVQAFVSNIVLVGITPSCPAPINVSANPTSLTEATISWEANGGNTWILEYGPSGFSQGSGTVINNITTTSYDLTGLTEGQSYDAYVKADCGGGNYSSSVMIRWTQPAQGQECQYAIDMPVVSDCSTATPYTLDFSSAFDIGTTSCDTYGSNYGKWFKFTAPNSGKVSFNHAGQTVEVAVFDSCGGNEILCQGAYTGNSNTDTSSVAITNLTAGQTYYMLVWRDANSGSTDLCLEEMLYSNPVFSLTPVGDCANNQFNVNVQVTDLGGASSVTVSDDQGSATQQLTDTATVTFGPYTEGTNVTITVTNDTDTSYTDSHSIQYYCPPANDACSTATEIASFPYQDTLDATHATNNNGSISVCSNVMNDGVWYKFTVGTAVDNITVSVSPNGWDAEVQVYSGDCNNLSCVARSDSGGTGRSETLTFAPSDNTTYYVNVGYWDDDDGAEGPFTIEITGNSTLAVSQFSTSDLRFYPNPTTGIIRWNATGTVEHIQITNLAGQVLMDTEQPAGNTLDISRLPQGVYLLRVRMDGNEGVYRILKE